MVMSIEYYLDWQNIKIQKFIILLLMYQKQMQINRNISLMPVQMIVIALFYSTWRKFFFKNLFANLVKSIPYNNRATFRQHLEKYLNHETALIITDLQKINPSAIIELFTLTIQRAWFCHRPIDYSGN